MIYISGAITGKHKKDWSLNLLAGRRVAVELCKLGIPFFSPHLNTWEFEEEPDLSEVTWQDFMDMDYEIIGRCSGVLMMKGWEKSKGAVLERQFAIDHSIPVFYEIKQILDHKPIEAKQVYDDLDEANTEIKRLSMLVSRVAAVVC